MCSASVAAGLHPDDAVSRCAAARVGPPVQYVAAALGVALDEIRETYERQPTPRDLT